MARGRKPYRLSRQAHADLEDIFTHTVRTWSHRQASRYLGEAAAALVAIGPAHGLAVCRDPGQPVTLVWFQKCDV